MTQTNTFNSINEVFNAYDELTKRYTWLNSLVMDVTNYDKLTKDASYFQAVRDCKQFADSISSALSNETITLPSRRSKSYHRYIVMLNNLMCLELNHRVYYCIYTA